MMTTNSNEVHPKVLFLVGAGASICVGVPAMKGMFKSYVRTTPKGSTERKTCTSLITKLKLPEDLEEFLLLANSILEAKNEPLGNFFLNIGAGKSTSRLTTIRNSIRVEGLKIERTRESILKFMAEQCFRYNQDSAIQLFTPFVQAIADLGYPVFTTNYDFVLEDVAHAAGIKIIDNFRKGDRDRDYWNPAVNFPTGNSLTIIKLHGSVTWYIDDSGNIEKIRHDIDINSAGNTVNKLAIFPTRFKDIYDQHFFALYSHFLNRLSAATTLIIIGHSLRDEYLLAAIVERFRLGNFQIIIIDPSFPAMALDELPPESIGKSGNVTHIPLMAEEFATDLATILRNSKPETIAEQCASLVHFLRRRTDRLKIKTNRKYLPMGEAIPMKVELQAYIKPMNRPATIDFWLERVTKSSEEKVLRQRRHLGISPRISLPPPSEIYISDTYNVEFKLNPTRFKDWKGSNVHLKAGLIPTSKLSEAKLARESEYLLTDSRYVMLT